MQHGRIGSSQRTGGRGNKIQCALFSGGGGEAEGCQKNCSLTERLHVPGISH